MPRFCQRNNFGLFRNFLTLSCFSTRCSDILIIYCLREWSSRNVLRSLERALLDPSLVIASAWFSSEANGAIFDISRLLYASLVARMSIMIRFSLVFLFLVMMLNRILLSVNITIGIIVSIIRCKSYFNRNAVSKPSTNANFASVAVDLAILREFLDANC